MIAQNDIASMICEQVCKCSNPSGHHCPACGGTGLLLGHLDDPCPVCAGEGTDPDFDEVE